MIVIFASAYDESSFSLAKRWSNQNARVLTCNDLSQPGWRWELPLNADSAAVIGGQTISVQEIKGVLIRWPGVFEQELMHIIADDRDYVAREMMSFLVAWFSLLPCPVINEPTPVNLTGPAWRPEHWINAAAQLGMAVNRFERHVNLHSNDATTNVPPITTTDVTVIGEHCFGDVEESLRGQSRKLASVAGTALLRVSFSGPHANSTFLGADLLPQLSDVMADAVLEHLLSREARCA